MCKPLTKESAEVLGRLFSKITVNADGCWLWDGATVNGYGSINSRKAGSRRAHRVAYEILVGAVPDGLDLDHLCRVRNCINPTHLEPVTRTENILRGLGPLVTRERNRRRTHCKRGHELTPENTGRQRAGRFCKACKRLQKAAYLERTEGVRP